jgi:hypothetical protein
MRGTARRDTARPTGSTKERPMNPQLALHLANQRIAGFHRVAADERLAAQARSGAARFVLRLARPAGARPTPVSAA